MSAVEFDFDLARALADQLEEAFDQVGPSPLTSAALLNVERRKGVYIVFLDGRAMYVGKANDLRVRLKQHMLKISGRKGLSLSYANFKCAYLHKNWAPIGTEEILIDRYQRKGEAEWNGSSFGSKDYGKNRDTTNQPPDKFDSQYPIDLEYLCENISAGSYNLGDLLQLMKSAVPYLFRFSLTGASQKNVDKISTLVPKDSLPFKELLKIVQSTLPSGRITVFSSHVILYINDKKIYPNGRALADVV